MLKDLLDFIKVNYPKSNLDEYLNSKYIKLSNSQLQKIAQAIKDGEITQKPASICPADNIIFHFGNTLVLLKKSTTTNTAYTAEIAWHTNFQSVHSTRSKSKGFYFINFSFDDEYNITMLESDKTLTDSFTDTKANTTIAKDTLAVIKGFMSAIS